MTEEIKDPDAVLAALERAKADAKKYREDLEALQTEHTSVVEQLSKQQGTIKDIRLTEAIKASNADPERVKRYLNTDSINLTDDGLEGFDDEFKRVKADLPELFDVKRKVGGAVEMFPQGKANSTRSVSEMQANRLLDR